MNLLLLFFPHPSPPPGPFLLLKGICGSCYRECRHVPVSSHLSHFPTQPKIPELKVMEGQGAPLLLSWSLRASPVCQSESARPCLCAWVWAWDVHLWGRGRQGCGGRGPAAALEASALGLPCPCPACPAPVRPATVPGSLSRPSQASWPPLLAGSGGGEE